MKRFLTYWAMWLFATLVLAFLFGTVFFDGRNIYLLMALIAAVFAVLSSVFEKQSERIQKLEERITALEEKENDDERV